jgi:hypothetical protein
MTEEQLVAEATIGRPRGVRLYRGGALAGIIYAFLNGMPSLASFNERIEHWAGASNPFFKGRFENLLPLIPFVIITVLLYLAGRELILRGKNGEVSPPRRS